MELFFQSWPVVASVVGALVAGSLWAAKVYFIDGDSPAPLPLMHLGDNK